MGRSFDFQIMTTATQDTILATIKVDMDTAEKSKQWPFSCYAVTKDMKGCLSGNKRICALNYAT